MRYLNKKYLSFLFLISTATACTNNKTIYGDLAPDEDGVISAEILSDKEDAPLAFEAFGEIDVLSEKEKSLIDEWHEGAVDKVSFIVVDAEDNKVMRSYDSGSPQRLASVSKLATSLGALENVNNVSVSKVKAMLKKSDNGEASRYVRLAAKALDGLELETKHYRASHSCPDEFLNDEPAAHLVFDWMKSELPSVDWTGATINDGAGCHYDNFMSALQTVKILEYAAQKGRAYAGLEYEDLLSINGKDGTWKKRNLDNKGYIFAKTGTLNPNGNLAGYFYSRRDRKLKKYYFTIFVQKKGPGKYSTRARKLMEEMMRYWINYYSKNKGVALKDF